jgi:hypothetical protein
VYISIPSFLKVGYDSNLQQLLQEFINSCFEFKEYFSLEMICVHDTLTAQKHILEYYAEIVSSKRYSQKLLPVFVVTRFNHNRICEMLDQEEYALFDKKTNKPKHFSKLISLEKRIIFKPIDEQFDEDCIDLYDYYSNLERVSLLDAVEVLIQFYMSVGRSYTMQIPSYVVDQEFVCGHLKIVNWLYDKNLILDKFADKFSHVLEVLESDSHIRTAEKVFGIKSKMYESLEQLEQLEHFEQFDEFDADMNCQFLNLYLSILEVPLSWWTPQDKEYIGKLCTIANLYSL